VGKSTYFSCRRPAGVFAATDLYQLLSDLLAARADLLLITGDKALQRDAAMKARVLSPQAFIEA
jgi:hypothetical protein